MKKYKVKVEQIKEYEIEIDDSKISIEDLEAFESVMYKLDEVEDDKYASFAYEIARHKANDLSFEGIGYPLIRGRSYIKDMENENINISMIIDYEELIKKLLDKMIKNIASKRDVNKFNKLHQWYANSLTLEGKE